jgi:hypothetical protein
MAFDRRDLLKAAFAGGAFPFLAPLLDSLDAAAQSAPVAEFDRDAYEFWTSQVSQPSRIFYDEGHLPSARGSNLANPVEVLSYSEATGFVRASNTDPDDPIFSGLVDKGDVSVLLSVDAIRPSDSDLAKILSAKNGSIRVDIKQGTAMQQLSEPLNWAAIASLFPNSQYMGYRDIAFDPKSTWGPNKDVPLTSGIGFWCWNFSLQPKPGIWSEMMQKLLGMVPKSSASSSSKTPSSSTSTATSSASSATPAKPGGTLANLEKMVMGVGLPSIATTALQAFDQLFGYLQSSSKTEWILQGTDTPVVASKDARQNNPGRAIALKSGSYVVVGENDVDTVMNGGYQLRDGFIVPKNSAGTSDDTIKTTVKEVSYIALSTIVKPVPASTDAKDKNCATKT